MQSREIVAVISFSLIASDSRVLRQISSLSAYYDVITVGYGPRPDCVVSHLEASSRNSLLSKSAAAFLLLFRSFKRFYFFWFDSARVLAFISANDVNAIVLNDVTAWPLARFLPPRIAILDAHEFSPQELSDSFYWNIFLKPFKLWCSSFASYGARHFCVEPYLCAQWEQFTGLNFQLLPNSSLYNLPPQVSSHSSGPLRVLHHGVAHPSRRIELMINAISIAGPSFHGTFLLKASSKSYIRDLKALAARSNCEILPPISQQTLIACGSSYDIAILSIFPSNLNYAHCLPNKLYQFIQSRLPIVCGPTPAIADIVRKYNIGIVADDFSAEALASCLQSLTSDLLELMAVNLERAARDLCWDNDQQLLLDSVSSVVRPED
jgi:glycosyltransferase involved in cell wall biosynthesis